MIYHLNCLPPFSGDFSVVNFFLKRDSDCNGLINDFSSTSVIIVKHVRYN